MKKPHLISVDELRAAGALDVPPAWRKSLGGGRERGKPLGKAPERQRDLFSDLRDDDPLPEKQEQTSITPDDSVSAEERNES